MKFKKTFRTIGRKMLYYPGWKTSRRIIVIESDDWGSQSIPGKEAFNKLQSAGINVQDDAYCTYDGLAEPEDLSKLFGVLTSFKDKNGRSPVITANTIVANPDFARIREDNFRNYFYEVFTETLQRSERTKSSFDLWAEGISKKIFIPQFHGREHLQVSDWLKALQEGNKQVHEAFNLGVYVIPTSDTTRKRIDFRAAFDCNSELELAQVKEIINEGLELFEHLFKYRSQSIIAPCYTWNDEIEPTLYQKGVSFLQGILFQKEPVLGKNRYRKKFNYLGKRNGSGQTYIVRNAFFEPALQTDSNQVQKTLFRIREAFSRNKPAVIGSHRLNFIGALDKSKRDQNLALLSSLLESILKEWPDVEFMSTVELGQLITRNQEIRSGSDGN